MLPIARLRTPREPLKDRAADCGRGCQSERSGVQGRGFGIFSPDYQQVRERQESVEAGLVETRSVAIRGFGIRYSASLFERMTQLNPYRRGRWIATELV